MNREILFRGKAINRNEGFHKTNYKNGDWVYGLITRLYDERFKNLPAEMTDINGVSGIEIDYKTICPYTGLTDKYGNKIFERDILQSCASENEMDWKVWIVKFKDGSFVFDSNSYVIKSKRKFRFETNALCKDEISFYRLMKIGNVHDNPELLEVSE